MDIKSILILALVCASGAISPGPSLAVVIRNTIKGGRKKGLMTGLGHGLGLTIYAFVAVMGLSSILIANQTLYTGIQMIGSLWLIWIGCNMISFSSKKSSKKNEDRNWGGFIEGFMISFLNPKILVFFAAVFSQFIHEELTRFDRIIIIMIAGIIDASWYALVAILLAGTKLIDQLRENSLWIDRATGLLVLGIAFSIIIKLFV